MNSITTPRKYHIGKFTLWHLPAGTFTLDAGSMFGVVPKVLWRKIVSTDEDNRIFMGFSPLLIQTKDALLLTDPGAGDDWDEKFQKIYQINFLKNFLEQTPFRPEHIDFVIPSHLHWDHAGAIVRFDGKQHIPAFPNAKIVTQRQEWEDAIHPNERMRASYFPERILPLEKQFLLLDGDTELLPGVRIHHTSGHTRGHQFVFLESEGKTAAFLGDLVPMKYHIPLLYIIAFDNYPMDTLEAKKKFYPEFLRHNTLLFFVHDPKPTAGRLVQSPDGKYSLIEEAEIQQ